MQASHHRCVRISRVLPGTMPCLCCVAALEMRERYCSVCKAGVSAGPLDVRCQMSEVTSEMSDDLLCLRLTLSGYATWHVMACHTGKRHFKHKALLQLVRM